MYGETNLNGYWYPSRLFEKDAFLMRSTIVWSAKAVESNIVGIDMCVEKDRARLAEEPSYMTKTRAWGDVRSSGKLMGTKKHRRRVSALPEANPMIPIDPMMEFEGISDNQIDTLDQCLGKLIQRAGTIDVTWREIAREGIARVYEQEVDDGTSRFQFSLLLETDYDKLVKYLCDDNYHWAIDKNDVDIEIIKEYSPDFKVVKKKMPGTFLTSAREDIFYMWNVKSFNVTYRVYSSLTEWDETGFQDNLTPGVVQSFYQPGSGFVITEIGENRSKIDFLVHRDVGGWAPKYIVQESMKNELLHLAHQLSNLDGQKKVLDMQPKEFSSLFDKMLQPQMKGLI